LRLAWPNNLRNFISKIARVKWAAGVLQAVERLLCKHKALSSNPSPTKKKKKKEERACVGKERGALDLGNRPSTFKKGECESSGRRETPHTHTPLAKEELGSEAPSLLVLLLWDKQLPLVSFCLKFLFCHQSHLSA
jgi:hypothetical protein